MLSLDSECFGTLSMLPFLLICMACAARAGMGDYVSTSGAYTSTSTSDLTNPTSSSSPFWQSYHANLTVSSTDDTAAAAMWALFLPNEMLDWGSQQFTVATRDNFRTDAGMWIATGTIQFVFVEAQSPPPLPSPPPPLPPPPPIGFLARARAWVGSGVAP